MKPWQRSGLFVMAAAALTTAAFLLTGAGLPQRAQFTGRLALSAEWSAPEVDAFAPLFRAENLAADLVDLRALRGSPVILNFWATWCAPCLREMPDLQALHTQYAAAGLRVIAVNLGESRPLIHDWVEELGLTFDIMPDDNGDITALYWVRVQPSTFVINPDGVITTIFYGQASREALYEAVAAWVNG